MLSAINVKDKTVVNIFQHIHHKLHFHENQNWDTVYTCQLSRLTIFGILKRIKTQPLMQEYCIPNNETFSFWFPLHVFSPSFSGFYLHSQSRSLFIQFFLVFSKVILLIAEGVMHTFREKCLSQFLIETLPFWY